MSRFGKLTLGIVASALLLTGGLLWALPEILRRVALDRVPRLTGRAVAMDDVDLNLFTGRLAIKRFRLADRPGPEPFAEFERLDVRVAPLALLRAHVLVRDIALIAPTVRVVRTGPAEFNFSDLLARPKEPPDPALPSRWTVTVERLNVARGRITVDDRVVSPPAEWLVQDLDIGANSLTTRTGATPGHVTIRTKLNEAVFVVSADPLRLDPHHFRMKLSLDGFETRRLNPYVYIPLGTPYRPVGGRLSIALTADVDSDLQEVQKATLAGTLNLEREALAVVGRSDPFVAASRLGIEIKQADLIARTLTVASVAIEGLDLKARRDARGVIDLLAMFTPKTPGPAAGTPARSSAGATPAAPAAPPPTAPTGPKAAPPASPERRTLFPIIQGLARGFHQIHVERITLAPSTALFVDEGVTPNARLALTKLQARVDNVTWPVRGPSNVTVSTGLPGGGTLDLKGPVTVAPFDTDVTIAIRNAPVEPYQPYIPIPARLSGRYNGDSKNRLAFRDGRLVAQSKGNSWAQDVEIRELGATRPAIRVERMELVGIDFDWPRRAALAKAGFRRPRVEIERGTDGVFNVRRLFTPPEREKAPEPDPKPASTPTGTQPKGLLETMRLEFREVRIEDGFFRFLDRTTQPAFSQDLSRLELTVTDLGNRPDRRAKLALQSVVGGDAGLDLRGEIGALGSPTFVDLVGELRNFKLPSVDPYTAANIGWVIKKGDLQYKVRVKLDGNQLAADNELVVGQLQVAPASASDEVKRRIGLPLGLIVALIKDQKGDIRVNVPVTGAVNDPKMGLRDAIWTAVKNVLTNIVTAPFKAIGRLFSRSETEQVEEPKVDPVTFVAGSSVLSPAMEDHLLRVADVLRRAPFVNLALTSVPSPADVEALKSDAVTARLQEFQTERGLTVASEAVAAYYTERLPDVALPGTVEEQLALLRSREPAPDAMLVELGRRRVETTRERLISVEGIPAPRLAAPDGAGAVSPGAEPAAPRTESSEGRVEFAIVAGE